MPYKHITVVGSYKLLIILAYLVRFSLSFALSFCLVQQMWIYSLGVALCKTISSSALLSQQQRQEQQVNLNQNHINEHHSGTDEKPSQNWDGYNSCNNNNNSNNNNHPNTAAPSNLHHHLNVGNKRRNIICTSLEQVIATMCEPNLTKRASLMFLLDVSIFYT
jgi:hypothetical protein